MLISNQLIGEYTTKGHPLGKAITLEEVTLLISNLRKRLRAAESELNLSLESLRKLEKRLADYYSSLTDHNVGLSQDDHIALLRELVAYLGETLVKSVDAKWDEKSSNLSNAGVVMAGQWKIQKNNRRSVSSYPTIIVLAGQAAYLWNSVISGKPSNVRQFIREVQSKSIRERL